MTRNWRRVAFMAGLWLVAATAVMAADRKPEEILKDLEATTLPQLDRAKINDKEAVTAFLAERKKAVERRGELAMELYRVAPDNDKLPALLAERWNGMLPDKTQAEALTKELDDVIANSKIEKLRTEALFMKVGVAFFKDTRKPEGMLPDLETFIKAAPKDPRGPSLLYMIASRSTDTAKKAEVEERILKDYSDSSEAGQIKSTRRRREAVGKPFELEFTEAISGSTISMKDLKGKVVVVDFWATWCGPCVAEMPKMKALYAEYKEKGVEFIGVSLDNSEDQGGLKKLKDFVHDKEIGWPQYYQGDGWKSKFSSSWGINSIPCVFIVDKEGNLYSTEARGKLEELIPELLKKEAKAPAAGGGGGK